MALRDIPYRVSHRDIRFPRLEFTTGELLFVLPRGHDAGVLLQKYGHWIQRKVAFIRECLDNSAAKKLASRSDDEFSGMIHAIAGESAVQLRVKQNAIYFRTMKTKWASLSAKKNLTVNTLMKYLPDYLIRYVIFHEMAHLVEKRHNGRFWNLISRKYKNYREKEKELFTYWFLVKARTAR
jgi:hypothetical protein